MVKITCKSDLPWSAIFSVIVHWLLWADLNGFLKFQYPDFIQNVNNVDVDEYLPFEPL